MGSCLCRLSEALLLIVELLTIVRALRLHYGDRGLQREIEHGFGRQLDLLRLGGSLHTAADASACCCADGCALAAACERSDDAADNGASAYFFRSIFAARGSFFLVLSVCRL